MQSGGRQQQGSVIGNLRVRRGRRTRQVVQVERPTLRKPRRPGVLILIVGFLALILVGTLLLWLPFASKAPGSAPLLTALFTATSAVCVTGLVVVDTRDTWTIFGQVVVVALIQLGGLGFMTSSTLLLLVLGRRLSVAQRVITGETSGRLGTEMPVDLIRRIIVMTLIAEAAGAVLLMAFFTWHSGWDHDTAWRGLFTAVSAFNNAGFDIEGGGVSFTGYAGSPMVLLTIAALTVSGGLGYAVVWDLQRTRGWRRLSLNSKIVLSTYAILLGLGTLVIFAHESTRGSMADVPLVDAFVSSFAESAFARTSGFTAFDLGRVQPEILLFLAGLMFIGGASASTAGGIKVTTFSALFFAILASLRGEEHVHAFGREIPWRLVNRALAVALLSVAFVFAMVFLLLLTTEVRADHALFEAVSAFSTTGLSAGITNTVNAGAQLTLILAMFVGRLGPLTIAIALAARFRTSERLRYPEADINIG